MNILIIGNGGREHALAWKVVQSPNVQQVFVAPGNAGTALETKTQNIQIAATDVIALVKFAKENEIDLIIVGPEAALAVGVVDAFAQAGLACFGPTQAAAQLESSKAFSKAFMQRHHIPTAAYQSFTEIKAAKKYLHERSLPIVIKADGLAAGKGVVIAQSWVQAEAAIDEMLGLGKQIVIEDFLQGEEASFIVMVDGEHVVSLATSQDHKTRDNGDRGPNTGGMGAYSPAPVITPKLQQRILKEIIEPTVQGMAQEGHPYCGFLYAGLMITPEGNPYVLEFNCRLGDPETQPILLRLQSDLVELCLHALKGNLRQAKLSWDPQVALGVVMVAQGYPLQYPTGEVIQGLPAETKDCKIFHAGTALRDNQIVTAGGRVLCVTALAETVRDAQQKAYALAKQIRWEHLHYRTDIGYRAVIREEQKV